MYLKRQGGCIKELIIRAVEGEGLLGSAEYERGLKRFEVLITLRDGGVILTNVEPIWSITPPSIKVIELDYRLNPSHWKPFGK